MFGSVSKLQISQAFLNMKFCRDFKIKVFAGHWRLKFGHEFVGHIKPLNACARVLLQCFPNGYFLVGGSAYMQLQGGSKESPYS